MSVKHVIPLICVGAICLAPIVNPTNKSVLTKDSKGVIRDTGTIIKVVDKGESNNGFVYCKFIIEQPIQRQLVGPCTTTDDMVLKVGYSYKSDKFKLDIGDKVNVYKATEISSSITLEVVEIKIVARTRLAVLSNGDVVSGNNVNVGDKVSTR